MKVMAGSCSRVLEVGALSDDHGGVADQAPPESSHEDISGSDRRRLSLDGVVRPESVGEGP